jgi:proline dehydrogenase
VIRGALSAVARNESVGGLLRRTPIAKDVVGRLVGGGTVQEAIEVAAELVDRGFVVSLERASALAVEDEDPRQIIDEYRLLVEGLAGAGLAGVSEATVLPEYLGAPGSTATYDGLFDLARTAAAHGVDLMVGVGPFTDVPPALDMVQRLREDDYEVGITLPAAHRRTEADCARLAGQRIRLVKGGRRGEPAVSFGQPIEIDKAFVRCAKVLLRGSGEPSFATHDPRLIAILESLADRTNRPIQTYEYAMFLGRQEGEQERLLGQGERVRVYVPYGPEWFERLVGGLAEQPSTITAALRSLLPGSS